MNEKEKFDFFMKIHEGLPRQGPGDFNSTKKAFELLTAIPPLPHILDIGCGPGMQTLYLSQVSKGVITAIDLYTSFLEELQKKILEFDLSDRIKFMQMDMNKLIFAQSSFDIIWAEGSVYIVGFKNALTNWKPYLKKNGYIAVTEVSWLKNDIPEELFQFWKNAYPLMNTIQDNIILIKANGYKLIGHFTLPESSWWDDYYTPLLNRIDKLKNDYVNNRDALKIIEEEQTEIDMYKKYSDYYGYVFYVMQLM